MEELCSVGHTVGELCYAVLPSHSVEEIKGKSKCRHFWEWWGKAGQTNHPLKKKYSASLFLSCLILFCSQVSKSKQKFYVSDWYGGVLLQRCYVLGDYHTTSVCQGTAPVCWALPLCARHWPCVLSSASLCWALPLCAGHCPCVLDTAPVCWALPLCVMGTAPVCWALPLCAGYCSCVLGTASLCWTLPLCAGHWPCVLGTGPVYWTVLHCSCMSSYYCTASICQEFPLCAGHCPWMLGTAALLLCARVINAALPLCARNYPCVLGMATLCWAPLYWPFVRTWIFSYLCVCYLCMCEYTMHSGYCHLPLY